MVPSAPELTYFIEVANSLNLSRASERLGISQPSLSLAIKRIEHSIGTHLLIRHKKGVTLTPAGKQFLAHARQLLQYWESTKSQTLASHEKVQGIFTLGCHSTMVIHSVSGFFAHLLDAYPKLEIQLKHDLSRKIAEQVINLSIDIGIVANPIKHPDLIIRKLCNDEVTFWMGKNKKIPDLQSGNATILCDPDCSRTTALFKSANEKNLKFARVITSNSLEVVANLTMHGCGIGILPTRVAKSMYPNNLKQIKSAPRYIDELCLIYRNENRDVKAIQIITKVIKDYFKN